jgi:2-polyprenyl-3-methyl-5-hydroxy-6-metoxy-1,4-benzoquinol methylase
MDRPDLPAGPHNQALNGLARLNRWSGSDRILWRPIRWLTAEITRRPLRLLDVACGAGDVLVGVAGRARRAGIELELHGIDISPTALNHARRRFAATGIQVSLSQHDAVSEPLPSGFDVVTASLFLHHLNDEQAVEVLRRCSVASQRLVLINDLRRSLNGWLLAATACHLLCRSPVVHADGPRSVERAFTPSEALQIAHRAGMANAAVSRRWPFRFLLSWDRANK